MTSPADGWVLYDADGNCIGRGTGYTEAQDGETLVPSASPMDEPDAIVLIEKTKARDEIIRVNNDDRSLAFEAKYTEAVHYMANAYPNPLAADDEDVIDENVHPFMYYEYWDTYTLSNLTPDELAQAIIDRHETKRAAGQFKTEAQKEAARRRSKLIAEAVLAQ